MNKDGGVCGAGFDARFFNCFRMNGNEVDKRSFNKEKIYAEYQYYQLIPEKMKEYMVQPRKYFEDGDEAQYTMDYINGTDFAKRWASGKVSTEEFVNLMEKVFEYLALRPSKKVSKAEYKKLASATYIDKLRVRIKEYLLEIENYEAGHDGISREDIKKKIENLMNRYKKMHKKSNTDGDTSVISHGDLCFSNMFFNNGKLLLVDPRGAKNENELWMDPYYDVAKLSHSVLGNYDFFNAGDYEVSSSLILKMKPRKDYAVEKDIFRKYLEKSGYEYRRVRLYEASLFLSMLPLHIDNIPKTIGFMLNAEKILDELEAVK